MFQWNYIRRIIYGVLIVSNYISRTYLLANVLPVQKATDAAGTRPISASQRGFALFSRGPAVKMEWQIINRESASAISRCGRREFGRRLSADQLIYRV